MIKFNFNLAVLLCLFLTSCNSQDEKLKEGEKVDTIAVDNTPSDKEAVAEDTTGLLKSGEITLRPLVQSPDFPDAILELNKPEENGKLKPGKVEFNYEIKNYELKGQTSGFCHDKCANSKDGQHIHLIFNNEPYLAKYEPKFEEELKEGHYVALSFLSRSYHESLKHRQAYDLRQFTVGKAANKNIDLTQPMLFYSRPKGEYVGSDTKNILLDFYIVNTDLAENGNKVRATINGNEFTINQWKPYLIEGLPMGETKIKLELLDKENKPVKAPFNPVERTITLKQAAS